MTMETTRKPASPKPPFTPASPEQAAWPVYESAALFLHGKVIVIAHAGRQYQLRITHGNKLILTA